jgi:hypothetical protein
MEDAALGAGPVVVFRAPNGGGVEATDRVDVGTGGVGAAAREAEFGDLQEERPAEKLVPVASRRSYTSHSALQARWNKRVIV